MLHPSPSLLLAPLLLLAAPAFAAPTGLLNDTGVTACWDGSSMVTCAVANAGDGAPYPGQDARFGRDAAQAAGSLPAKIGGGAAGFDFSPLDASGNAIAISGGVPVSPPACVRDNVTNLIWEVKTAGNMYDTYTFAAAATYAASADTTALCGLNSGWRVPTRRELFSIGHRGVDNPAIDGNYFPNTVAHLYWSNDSLSTNPAAAWLINFVNASTWNTFKSSTYYVRLVRSGL